MRFAHFVKHSRRAMLGSNLELTADVMGNKLSEKAVVLIRKHIIITDSRTHENLFDFRKRTYGTKNIQILQSMVNYNLMLQLTRLSATKKLLVRPLLDVQMS